MKIRSLIASILSLVTGMVVTATLLLPTHAAESKPKPEWSPTKTECRGNGAGGFRACRVFVAGRVDKVVYDLFINNEYEVGIIWSPGPGGGGWKVAPSTETED